MRTLTLDTLVLLFAGLMLLATSILHSVFADTHCATQYERACGNASIQTTVQPGK